MEQQSPHHDARIDPANERAHESTESWQQARGREAVWLVRKFGPDGKACGV